MKKLKVTACILASALLCAGCGGSATTAVDGDAIIIKKDGKVASQMVDVLDQDYYNSDELKEKVEEEVQAFNAVNGEGSVELTEYVYEKSDSSVKIVMTFGSMQDYVSYNSENDYEFKEDDYYSGSVDITKVAVDSLKVVKKGEFVDGYYVKADNHTLVLVSGENTVVVPGSIIAVSENVEVIDKSQVKITSSDEPACIIYE